jgi:hypothetical protein
MKLPWRKLLPGLLLVLVLMQLVRPQKTNPPIDPARTVNAALADAPAVAAHLERSCTDCHSYRTTWPWYSNVAPASWLIAYDVNKGRRELNFSDWASYSPEKNQKLLKKICREVSRGEMPGTPYTLLHPESKLTVGDVQEICRWTETTAPAISAETEE